MGGVNSAEAERAEGVFAKLSFEQYTIKDVHEVNLYARAYLADRMRMERARAEMMDRGRTPQVAPQPSGSVTPKSVRRQSAGSVPASRRRSVMPPAATTPVASSGGGSGVSGGESVRSEVSESTLGDGPLRSLFSVNMTFSDFYSVFGPGSWSATRSTLLALPLEVYRLFDRDHTGKVPALELFMALALYSKGHVKDRMAFCFEVFDDDGNAMLDMDEMLVLIRAGCNTLYKIGDLPMTPTESVLQRVRDDLFATANANLPEDEKKEALDIHDFYQWARQSQHSSALMAKLDRAKATLKLEARQRKKKEEDKRWQIKAVKHRNQWGTSNPVVEQAYDLTNEDELGTDLVSAGKRLRTLMKKVNSATALVPEKKVAQDVTPWRKSPPKSSHPVGRDEEGYSSGGGGGASSGGDVRRVPPLLLHRDSSQSPDADGMPPMVLDEDTGDESAPPPPPPLPFTASVIAAGAGVDGDDVGSVESDARSAVSGGDGSVQSSLVLASRSPEAAAATEAALSSLPKQSSLTQKRCAARAVASLQVDPKWDGVLSKFIALHKPRHEGGDARAAASSPSRPEGVPQLDVAAALALVEGVPLPDARGRTPGRHRSRSHSRSRSRPADGHGGHGHDSDGDDDDEMRGRRSGRSSRARSVSRSVSPQRHGGTALAVQPPSPATPSHASRPGSRYGSRPHSASPSTRRSVAGYTSREGATHRTAASPTHRTVTSTSPSHASPSQHMSPSFGVGANGGTPYQRTALPVSADEHRLVEAIVAERRARRSTKGVPSVLPPATRRSPEPLRRQQMDALVWQGPSQRPSMTRDPLLLPVVASPIRVTRPTAVAASMRSPVRSLSYSVLSPVAVAGLGSPPAASQYDHLHRLQPAASASGYGGRFRPELARMVHR